MNSKISVRELFLTVSLTVLLGACTSKSQNTSSSTPVKHTGVFASLKSVPEDPTTFEARLGRYRGQTEFLNPQVDRFFPMAMSRSAGLESADAPKGGGQRAVQESDVFKVGKAGSKLLYLLNNYRGLQIVSYEKGATQPELIGRVPATGNYPSDMYFDEKNDQLFVLENNWYDDSGEYTSLQSRILVYNVSDSKNPVLANTLNLDGEIADSRFVGEVLYIATSTRPDYRNDSEQKAHGNVYSISFKKGEAKVVAKADLKLPVSLRENMNIVEVKQGEAFKYYLVAILSESGWGWWDRQSLVEVVDVSDPKGAIQGLMVVSAKGMISERSQTHIKNGTLIVASNYQIEGDRNNRARVAVETFKLPTSSSEIISEDEAQYRKLHIERQLKAVKEEKEKEDLYKKLVADAQLGLQDRFVKAKTGSLTKVVSDSVVTVGDTNGQSASLRDVRFAGDLLYAFWVPANNIDPFDLFDISAPEKEVKYLRRLQFDGWIDRSFPIDYKGRKFVLGLGWVVPNVNNENGRRVPQAMLYEIIQTGATSRAIDVAQLSFADSKSWANFNAPDKEVELKLSEDGTGTVMFQISSWGNAGFNSGGKLIGLDLNAAIAGEAEKVFSEGGLLSAPQGWLKRIFRNSEIDKLNTFSDEALATFETPAAGASAKVYEAANILELARDIEAFVNLSPTLGVQVVRHSNWTSTGNDGSTDLRLVNRTAPDAELPAVLNSQSLKGVFSDHLAVDGGVLIATASSSYDQGKDENGRPTLTFRTVYGLSQVSAKDNALVVKGTVTWEVKRDGRANRGPFSWAFPGYRDVKFVQLKTGEILVQTGAEVKRVTLAGDTGGIQVAAVEVKNCDLKTLVKEAETDERATPSLTQVDGQVLLQFNLPVFDKERNLRFSKNYVSAVTLAEGSLTCGAAVNIPGTPVSWSAGRLIVQDERLVDIVKDEEISSRPGPNGNVGPTYRVVTETALASLELNQSQATLRDDYRDDALNLSAAQKDLDGALLFIETPKDQDSWGGGLRRFGRRFSWGGDGPRLTRLALNDKAEFTRDVRILGTSSPQGSSIQLLLSEGGGTRLAVLTTGQKIQLLRWKGALGRPEVVKLKNKAGEKGTDTVSVAGAYFYGFSGQKNLTVDPLGKTLTVAASLSGVAQWIWE